MALTPVPADAGTAVTTEVYRRLLRRHAAAVAVVTVAGDPPAGFTATSFTSVSLRPPLVSFAVARAISSWPAVRRAGAVAVHLLGDAQEQVARTFATGGIDRFAVHGSWRPGPGGVPLLDGVLAWLLCRVVRRVPAGDHAIVLAAPVLVRHGGAESAPPLVYHAGRYTTVSDAVTGNAPPALRR
jgi:flavin reductase (DIM6/NTAB) family NADH-FMN oxidoreductase RutF